MAWYRASTVKLTGYNLNFGLDYDDSTFTTTSVKCRTVIEKTANTWYSDRFAANGGVFSNFTLKESGASIAQTASNWPFYKEFYLYKGSTASSFSTGAFAVANTGGNSGWTNFQSTQNVTPITLIAPSSSIATAPSVGTPSISNITRTSAYVSFSSSANGQSPYSPYIDLSSSNFGTVIKSLNAKSGTFSSLSPNTTYYVRANDANDAGRSYSSVSSFKTSGNAPNIYGATCNPFIGGCFISPEVSYDTNDGYASDRIDYGTSTNYGNYSYNNSIGGLAHNTLYYYKITVTSTQGRSGTYTSSFTTKGENPIISDELSTEYIKSNIIKLNTPSFLLDTNASISSIRVHVEKDGWTSDNTTDARWYFFELNEELIFDGLKPGKKYKISMDITDSFNRKSETKVLYVKTKGGFKFNGKMSDTIKIGNKEVIGMKFNGIEII